MDATVTPVSIYDTQSVLGVGDRVRIYIRSVTNVPMDDGSTAMACDRCLQPGVYSVVRANRHGDWTVRHNEFGYTVDVFRDDVELISD